MSDESRSDAWIERQRAVLADLRGAEKRERVASRGDLSYWEYVGLEQGRTRLLAEHLPKLAKAFRVSRDDLLTRLGLLDGDDSAQTYDPRAVMLGGGMPGDLVERHLEPFREYPRVEWPRLTEEIVRSWRQEQDADPSARPRREDDSRRTG